MSAQETRKVVTATLTATFEGDYIRADDAPTYLEQWVDGGLEDRDDLRGWTLTVQSVIESPLDPDEESSEA